MNQPTVFKSINFRLPEDVHRHAIIKSFVMGPSLNKVVNEAIAHWLEEPVPPEKARAMAELGYRPRIQPEPVPERKTTRSK